MSEKTFYGREGVPSEEIERLQSFEYPNQISATVLSELDLAGKIVADVGSGPNPELGSFVLSKQGKYLPVDLRSEMLQSLRDKAGNVFSPVAADVKNLPFADGSLDIVHQRFVLMHLSEQEQSRAIDELVRVSKEAVELLEYNWGSMRSSLNPEVLSRFLELTSKLMMQAGIDQNIGAKLSQMVSEKGIKASEKRFQREEGDYTNELIMLCKTGSRMARARLKDEQLAVALEQMASELENNHIAFVPAEIVSVKIAKN